jgi:hypothetical protein
MLFMDIFDSLSKLTKSSDENVPPVLDSDYKHSVLGKQACTVAVNKKFMFRFHFYDRRTVTKRERNRLNGTVKKVDNRSYDR